MLPKTLFNTFQAASLAQTTFEHELGKYQTALELALVTPLWNYAPEEATAPLQAAALSQEIGSIFVYDATGKPFAHFADTETTKNNANELRIFEILRNGRSVGKVQMTVDRRILSAKLQMLWISFFVENLLVIFLVGVLSHVIFSKSILAKFYKLREQFQLIEAGTLDQEFHWEAGDELNDLGISLNKARLSLVSLLQDVAAKNASLNQMNQFLESQVTVRTSQLIESARLTSLGEMAGGMAHEINNPLMILMARVLRIRRRISKATNLEPIFLRDTNEDLEKLDQILVRVSKIIKALKTYARDGKDDASNVVQVSHLVSDALELCRSQIKNQSIDLKICDYDQTLKIECREVQIGQVLLNLLNNAIAAVEGAQQKWIQIEIRDHCDAVSFVVRDSGPGVPTELKHKIMYPFFTTKPVGKGTGLGLSISKGIVESHQGTLELDEESEFTTFVVRIPKMRISSSPKQAA